MKRTARAIFWIIAVCALVAVSASKASAAATSCSASVSPTNVTPSSTQEYAVSVSNTGDTLIQWVRISRPSGNFTIESHTIGAWTVQLTSDNITLTDYTMGVGGAATFTFTVTTNTNESASADWTVIASDDSGGASPASCTGTLGTSISSTPPDTSGPNISDIIVSDITDSGAKITWTTDESSNSVVDYGRDDTYGSSSTGNASTTAHEVTISGLSANTTYHYNAKSADGSGNTAESGDNTFSTAKSGYTGSSVSGTVTTVIRTVGPTPTPTPVPDRTPPKVTMTTELKKVYTQVAEISGKVTDPGGVSSVEYSLDNGENFLPVDELVSPGKTASVFRFVPYQTDDGNYQLVIRATDIKGNSGKTKAGAFVIDRLPPVFGAFMLSSGPQIIEPEGDHVRVVSGVPYTFTMSAVGGPVEASLHLGEAIVVPLVKNNESGLWRGGVTTEGSGNFPMRIIAKDGAGNTTKRPLGTLQSLAGGTIRDRSHHAVSGGRIEIYVKDLITRLFTRWDGASYGQSNPISVSDTGVYGLLLPSGTYYLRITAPGYKPLVSRIFSINTSTPLVSDFTLEHKRVILIGSWSIPLPDFSETTADVQMNNQPDPVSGNQPSIVGSMLPFFRFPYLNGFFSSLDLRGKPSVITFLNSWSPVASVQLKHLDSLVGKAEIHSIVIVPEESAGQVATFARRGAYTVRIVADPDGTLVDPLGIFTTPTHIFVNRKGEIRSVKRGLVTSGELMDTIMK